MNLERPAISSECIQKRKGGIIAGEERAGLAKRKRATAAEEGCYPTAEKVTIGGKSFFFGGEVY